jgi:glycosyltransferase involved in cell wall biosynthesis
MPDPLFSVIIATYDRPEFLAAAVASVLAQTVDDFEVIIVDDAGPQPAEHRGDSRVRVIRRTTNGGPAAARNTGLAHARGRYLTFLDDDDLYTPDRLALAREGLERSPLTHCWIQYVDAPAGRNRILDGAVGDRILDGLTPHLGTVAVARSVAEPFDERFLAAEDVEWWLRLAQRAPVSTVPRVGYLLRRHSAPRHRIDPGTRLRSRLLLLDVHAGYFATHAPAAAFQWKRIGLMAYDQGERTLARSSFARSFRLQPRLNTLWHLARALPSPRGGTPVRTQA